jgi:hypothetical protein
VYVTGSLTGGIITLDNSTLVVEGAASGGAIVVMNGNADTLDLANASTLVVGNPVVYDLSQNDSIGLGTSFNSVTVNNPGGLFTTATFKNGNTTVATISTPELSDNFFSVFPTEAINGTTYTIGTVDPPSGATGVTGGATGTTGHHHDHGGSIGTGATGGDPSGQRASGSTGGAGASHGSPVTQDDVLGSLDGKFLHGTNGPATDHVWTSVLPPDVARGVVSDLTNVGDPRSGNWTPEADRRHGMDTRYHGHAHGSVGGADEHDKPHHHDLWKPDH